MIEELERQQRMLSFDAIPVYDLKADEIDLQRFEKWERPAFTKVKDRFYLEGEKA